MRDLAGTEWDFHPLDIDAPEHRDLARAVGRVAVLSAELESSLRSLFCDLMGGDEAFVITQGESSDWLLKNCERLIGEEHRNEASRQGKLNFVLPLLKECRATFQERGTVIHSSWGLGGGSATGYIAMSSKKFRDTRVYECSLADINLLADRFAGLYDKLQTISVYDALYRT